MNIIKLFACLTLTLALAIPAMAQKNFTKDADAAFANEAYYQAKDLYKKAFPKASKAAEKARIIFQIAECYRFMTDAEQAEVWYAKAIKAKYPDPIAQKNLAMMLKQQGKYAEALKEFNEYNKKRPGDKEGEDGAKACELAQEWKDNPTRYEVDNMVLINSKQYDFSPMYADKKGNKLYFTSSRTGATGSKTDERTGQNFQDVFETTFDKKGKPSEPVLVASETLNSDDHEGSVTFDKKFSNIYFTRCPNEKNMNLGCNIWTAPRKGSSWGDATMIDLKSHLGLDQDSLDKLSVGHPGLDPEDKYMIFASDMPGGKGGKDLWIVTYDKKAKTWGKPKLLPGPINTPGDEMFPYIHEDGRLFFASNGHVGMGGLDIFSAQSTGEMQWGDVENMKAPINSEGHDYGLVFEKGEDRGYFTSDRPGGKGHDDIYSFRMPPVLFTLEVIVKNKESREPVTGANIKLIGTDNSSYEVQTDDNGGFFFELNNEDRYINPEVTYSIQIDKEKYLIAKDQISTVGLTESTNFIQEVLIQAVTEKAIALPEVRYAYNKAELQVIPNEVNSMDSLNTLFQTLIENPTIVVELQAHTDERGSATYNRKLSQRRAQSCVDYLVSLGIPAERMRAKGFGEDKPRPGLTPADIKAMKTKEETEAAHQKNRRTEFTVLSFDYKPVNTYGVTPGTESNAESFLKTGKVILGAGAGGTPTPEPLPQR